MRTKLESTINQQSVKREEALETKRGIKREPDEEVDEILASAHIKKAKILEVIDLSGD